MIDTAVVLAVAVVPRINIKEVWVTFEKGQHLRYIPAHEIATTLGPEKSKAQAAALCCHWPSGVKKHIIMGYKESL